MAPDQAPIASTPATAAEAFHIVLQPVSHPELGPIAIDDDLFAIGRTEAPFASYPPAVVDALSRRHARIFSERGSFHIADLGSKNGTTVNGVGVRERPTRLRDGDEVRFGGELAYRVKLEARAPRPAAAGRVVGVTLAPERDDLGLQPIVVSRFPFLVSKNDEAFARYREEYPHQVNYLSRRHAHIFLKGGVPYVEDLGSTNGTFVAGQRLDEHAVPLEEGDVLAFGGHHFVYRVGLRRELALDPTVTRLAAPGDGDALEAEKTTFVAAPDSFLDIFCVDQPPQPEDEVNPEEAKPAEAGGQDAGRKRGRLAVFLSELAAAFSGGGERNLKPWLWWGGGAAALVALVAFGVHFRGASEREVKDLMAGGQYARSATAADRYLAQHPDNAELKALGTEAVLRAHVPPWIAQLKGRNFDGAATTLAGMKPFAVHNSDVQAAVGELEWIGALEQFFVGRGGDQAPIRIYADEERIKGLLRPWEEDAPGHQRILDRIAAYVPEFKDFYPQALSHLRKLQGDDSVYLAAIERLKAAIAGELNQDRPEAVAPLLQEYGEKYPRLAGLEGVREDLRRYLEIDAEVQAGRLGRLALLLSRASFSTPPFQARLRDLAAKGRLPPADVLKQYEAASRAWRQGDIQQAFAGLQQMGSGPWAGTAARELARRKRIAERYAELQKSGEAKGYDERLLAFWQTLDPDDDAYFVKATEADLAANRDKVLKRAQELMGRARDQWARYRENGAIAGEERAETAISGKFRGQARLLGEAQASARQGQRLYALLQAEVPAEWSGLQGEIAGEAARQRRSLLELGPVLEPGLLKAKLALMGEPDSEQGQSP
ncbi:MAG TPA: FHA domain-containing protein [Rhodocyclaceae bacterium]|nr:FHA domain-containing protein [Rhodocyclaceae bacterium]